MNRDVREVCLRLTLKSLLLVLLIQLCSSAHSRAVQQENIPMLPGQTDPKMCQSSSDNIYNDIQREVRTELGLQKVESEFKIFESQINTAISTYQEKMPLFCMALGALHHEGPFFVVLSSVYYPPDVNKRYARDDDPYYAVGRSMVIFEFFCHQDELINLKRVPNIHDVYTSLEDLRKLKNIIGNEIHKSDPSIESRVSSDLPQPNLESNICNHEYAVQKIYKKWRLKRINDEFDFLTYKIKDIFSIVDHYKSIKKKPIPTSALCLWMGPIKHQMQSLWEGLTKELFEGHKDYSFYSAKFQRMFQEEEAFYDYCDGKQSFDKVMKNVLALRRLSIESWTYFRTHSME
jgi:hypothetical protein